MLLFGPGDLEEKMKSIMERFESTSEEIHVERDVIETNSESDPEDVFARQAEAEARMLSEIVSRIRMDAEDVLKCIEDGRSTSMAKMRLQESLDGANKALSQVGDGLANRTESASEMNLALSELQELLLWSEEGSES